MLSMVVLVLPFQKPRLDGLALIVGQAKAIIEPSLMAWFDPAYLGLAWLGPRPEHETGLGQPRLSPGLGL
jgi:hypothetical protein